MAILVMEAPRWRRSAALLGISLGYFMVLLDTTVVTVALPTIGTELGGGLAALQWVANGYTLAFAALLLTAGGLADRLGARRVFLGGLVAFGVLSGVSALAGSIEVLVALRALLGVAGAALLPASLAIIAAAFPEPGARARALGGWAAITGVALAAGPLVGGALTDLAGWRSIFLLNVPTAIVAMLLTGRFAPATSRRPDRGGLDVGGQLTAVVALTALTFGLVEAGERGWGEPLVIGALAIAVLAGTAFMVVESRSAHPMLPLRLFRNRVFAAGVTAGLLVNFALSGALFVLTLYFQTARGYSAVLTGLAFLPLTLPTAFNPLLTGRLVARIGPRRPAVLGFGLMAAAALALACSLDGPAGLGSAALFVFGTGVSFAIPALITATVGAVPAELAGTGSGALNSARQTGAVLGVAALGSIVGSSGNSGTAIAMGAIATALVMGAAVLMSGMSPS